MTDTLATIREFRTPNFRVEVTAEPEFDVDLSWDDTGEVAEGLDSGRFIVFCAKAACYGPDGEELATDYLGQCIYESFNAFMDHKGIKLLGEGYGSYFSDMVRNVCDEGRKAFAESQKKRANVRVRVA